MWITSIEIVPGFRSDHSAIVLEVIPYNTVRGRGLWKLNNQVLYEAEYLDLINDVIKKNEAANSALNAHEKWETLKLHCIANSQRYCQERASNRKLILSQLESKLAEYESELKDLSQAKHEMYVHTKQDFEKIIDERTQGAIFRSQCTWYSEGERNTKYYFSLEKARSGAKGMSCLLTDSGTKITNPQIIMKEQEKFYSKLYTADEDVKFDYQNKSGIMLDNNDREKMTGLFTMEELSSALKNMKRNVSPGCDGLTTEFFICIFNKFREQLLEAINFSYKQEKLFGSALRGVISLIPKKGKDNRKLAHNRPISLLCTDYKLIEKMLANRICPALEKIVDLDQKGFMSSRRIGCNIRRVLDIVQFTEELDIPSVVISVDFLKCFDRIETSSLIAALRYFKFDDMFINWTKIIYTDSKSCVMNNGTFSNYFKIGRSVKQGGPCSAFYFLVLAEVLVIELRDKGNKIEGILINEIKKALGQYADDIDMYLLGEKENIKRAFNVISAFEKRSGFRINYDKTTIYRIGSLSNPNAELYTKRGVKWTNESINVLGVEIAKSNENLLSRNYEPLLQKTSTILNMWARRGLSLKGKILIVNVLVASLYIYKMTVLPAITNSYVKRIDNAISKFLWNGRRAKIPLDMLKCSIEDGGMGLVDFAHKDASLKVSWIQSLNSDPFVAEFAYHALCPVLRDEIWKCNLKATDVDKMFKKSFWRDVVKAWSYVNYVENVTENVNIMNQVLWYNSHLKINKKVYCMP